MATSLKHLISWMSFMVLKQTKAMQAFSINSSDCKIYMVDSPSKGTQYRPKNIMVLIMRIPKIVSVISGNPYV